MKYLRVTQGENDSYSHKGSLAMDFGGKDQGSDKLYAPCDMIVKRCRQKANGEMYLESTEKVEFADGTIDYAHLLCLHDSVFNYREGQVVKQGEHFYDEGGMGNNKPNRFGTHVHIEAGKGKWQNTRQFANKYNVYVSENQNHLYDLFWLDSDVTVLDSKGYNWKRVVENVVESNLSKEPSRLKIGFASGGDIKAINAELERLGIVDNHISDGYITTNIYVSYGDKLAIENKCKELGIEIVDYVEPVQPPVDNEVTELKEKISVLEEQNTNLKADLREKQQQIDVVEEKNRILTDKINKIKEIIE